MERERETQRDRGGNNTRIYNRSTKPQVMFIPQILSRLSVSPLPDVVPGGQKLSTNSKFHAWINPWQFYVRVRN